MKVLNKLLMASALLSVVSAATYIFSGYRVSPWGYLLATISTTIGYAGWLMEEKRADRWMARAITVGVVKAVTDAGYTVTITDADQDQ